jgi:hypothetical protein
MKLFESIGAVMILAVQPVWAQTVVDRSAFKPPVCIAQGQRCYRTNSNETENRFNNCCTDSNGSVSMTCSGGIWNSVCTRCSGNNCSNKLPRFDPKGVQGQDWGIVEVSKAGSSQDSCTAAANLGPSLSKSTGYNNTFPLLGSTNINNPVGRESQVGFLVGGNYFAPLAAEIEGNIVVLGDFKIGPLGTNSLGT